MNAGKHIVFCLTLFSAGCASRPQVAPANTAPIANPRTIQAVLPHRFSGYSALFQYIAENDLVGLAIVDAVTPDVVLKLAAESSVRVEQRDKVSFYVVEPHYYVRRNASVIDQVRGASGNGSYYLVQVTGEQSASGALELVGIADGNGYRWESMNSEELFVVSWHLSATENPETFYRWRGRIFEEVIPSERLR